MEFFSSMGAWFGFVGACVAGADVTCRPFLAFVALLAAAGTALALLLIAFRSAQVRESAARERQRTAISEQELKERMRRAVAQHRAAIKPAYHGRVRAAA